MNGLSIALKDAFPLVQSVSFCDNANMFIIPCLCVNIWAFGELSAFISDFDGMEVVILPFAITCIFYVGGLSYNADKFIFLCL